MSVAAAKDLQNAVNSHISALGESLLQQHEVAVALSVAWLDYLRNSQAASPADNLLDGFHASLIEAAGCTAMGLIRPAVFSFRAQVDILFAWLFFKDHPIEWHHVETSGEKYRLVSEVLKYLRTFNTKFSDRMALLRENRTGGELDPYGLLSAHVHSQNSATLPPLVHLHELVQTKERCEECIRLQGEISEYLSDVLLSIFAAQWADLPNTVTDSIKIRLDAKGIKKLCHT